MYFKACQLLIDFVLLILFLPFYIVVLLITSIIVLIFDGRPIFFVQERVGLNLKSFKIYKFRTMSLNVNLTESERISKVGNFLRRSSLDELPQLINILKRDMSFVGPRPLTREVLISKSSSPSAYKRSSVLPGLTGYTQAKYTGSRRSFDQKLKIDLEYVDKKTCLLLFKILFMTIKVLFVRFKHNKTGETL
jgi:lipopolysaccharide/colanic/teichoic acid biosynthesis glycosyltransferase